MTPIDRALESAEYWYKLWLRENTLLIDSEDRLAKSNELSLHRYEVGEEILKANANLRSKIEELQEWHEESLTSHSEAFDLGFKAAKNLYIQEQDQESYASGYEAGRNHAKVGSCSIR